MKRVPLVGSQISLAAILFAACGISEPSDLPTGEETGKVTQASTFGGCEDECDECGNYHCPSETRYLCVLNYADGVHRCPPSDGSPRTLGCVCCAPNECRDGHPLDDDSICYACPPGQVCDDRRNECCIPATREQACGSRTCGSVSNNCGGTLSCGTCSTGKVCQNGQCVTPPSGCMPGACRPCGTNKIQTCTSAGTWGACRTAHCP